MLLPSSFIVGLVLSLSGIEIASAATAKLPIAEQSAEVDSDLAAIYYGSSFQKSLLVGNDGGAATGGIRSFSLGDMEEVASRTPGRTKVAGVMYDVGKKDLIVSIAAPDSIIRVFDIDDITEIPLAKAKALGDWSSLCTWRSPSSGGNYFYLLGKKEARQFLVREKDSGIEILEVSILATHVLPYTVETKRILGPKIQGSRVKFLHCFSHRRYCLSGRRGQKEHLHFPGHRINVCP